MSETTDFRELMLEASAKDMSIEDFRDSLEKSFYKHFPNGVISIKDNYGIYKDSILVKFGMIGDESDNLGGYFNNDPMKHSFILEPKGDDIYSFDGDGWINLKPQEGSYRAMDILKTRMTNSSKITLQKTDVKMAKFFKKLSGLMKDNVDEIYGVDDIDVKYLTFK